MSTFKNPIGSIQETDINWQQDKPGIYDNLDRIQTDDPYVAGNIRIDDYIGISNVSQVTGRGGSVRHQGIFSPDNPHYAQLAVAKTNADRDWLYEMAVKWEADRANLEEQRAYDDPRARLARERQAGIDSTLSGGAGAGSSSGASSVMPATQSNLSPSNYYDNVNVAFQGISSASNLLTTLVDAGSKIVGCVDTIKTQQSRIGLADAQANLADSTANQIDTMLPIQQSAGQLANIRSRISLLGDVGKMIPKDSTAEQRTQYFTAMGIPEAEQEAFGKAFDFYSSSPQMQAYYADEEDKKRRSQARNRVYTPELYGRIISTMGSAELVKQQLDFNMASIKELISGALLRSDSNFVNDTIATVEQNASNSLQNSKFMREQLDHNISSWKTSVLNLGEAYQNSRNLQNSLLAKYKKFNFVTGQHEDGTYEDLSDEDRAIYDNETVKQLSVFSLGSDSINQWFQFMLDTNRNRYQSSVNWYGVNYEWQRRNWFMRATFSGLASGDINASNFDENFGTGPEGFIGEVVRQFIKLDSK